MEGSTIKKQEYSFRPEQESEILTHLKFIGTLERDKKIDTKHLRLETNHLFTPLKRLLLGDSRENAYQFMYQTIEKSFIILYYHIESLKISDQMMSQTILQDLLNCIEGLKNVQYTYKEDKLFGCSIQTLIDTIQGKIAELRERFPIYFKKKEEID